MNNRDETTVFSNSAGVYIFSSGSVSEYQKKRFWTGSLSAFLIPLQNADGLELTMRNWEGEDQV